MIDYLFTLEGPFLQVFGPYLKLTDINFSHHPLQLVVLQILLLSRERYKCGTCLGEHKEMRDCYN